MWVVNQRRVDGSLFLFYDHQFYTKLYGNNRDSPYEGGLYILAIKTVFVHLASKSKSD